tara:strand:+ start:6100 stop:7257 length:1158 start_codon:yes stop_codon:yes gene_type:complete
MAYYSIFPEKDTTIYSHPDRIKMNTGQDEVLEILKERGKSDQRYYPSRILIQFNNEEIKDVISNKIGSSIFNNGITKANIELFSAEHKNLATILNIETFAVSQSWNEGSGRFTNIPLTSNGSSWTYRDNDISKTQWTTSSFATATTGSINASGIAVGGGEWYTGSLFQGSQQFLRGSNMDVNLDVTSIVQKHSASLFVGQTYPTGINNNGFIIKQPNVIEENTSSSFGEMQYFSTDTHTIYPPKLTFKWDDSSYSIGSGTVLNSGDIFLSLYNNKKTFQRKSKQRFRLTTRKRYPDRTFTTTSNYLNVQYLPITSYYSLRDGETDEIIIPFDTSFTKLSADSEGMYFDLYMEGLQPERYYKLMFRSDNSEGVQIFDEDYIFKIVR